VSCEGFPRTTASRKRARRDRSGRAAHRSADVRGGGDGERAGGEPEAQAGWRDCNRVGAIHCALDRLPRRT